MENKSIALGSFDGLHLGHMAVLNNAKKNSSNTIAVTFDIPPKLNKNKTDLIMTAQDKIDFLKNMGVIPVIIDFNMIRQYSPEKFLNELKDKYSPQRISVGFNYKFGYKAEGNVEFLKKFCSANNIECCVEKPVTVNGITVSSSKIRDFISNGNIEAANNMLGRNFSFTAPIIHGDERGRTIGFPTVNQKYPQSLITPKFGVYCSLLRINGKDYKAVTNIGIRPTFKTDYIISETYIFDFNSQVYGENATVYLTDFIRGETRFNSLEELKAAIEKDKNVAIKKLNSY